MKAALCFIISYNQLLSKEHIWKEWIEYNKDILNVYFHYKNYSSIKSAWIRDRCIPKNRIAKTTYFHVVPAYMSVLTYAFNHDLNNKWFCLLTETCVPIISPQQFRKIFFNYYYASILKWRQAYWNIEIHRRANLRLLSKRYQLANDPWFTLSRNHVHKCIMFLVKKNDIYKKVCAGGLANESIFAIILETFNDLLNRYKTINESSTLTDWSRMSNATSPHVFSGIQNLDIDIKFISDSLKQNKYALFLRKVAPEFPDTILLDFIYRTDYKHKYICLEENSDFVGIVFAVLILTMYLLFLADIFLQINY